MTAGVLTFSNQTGANGAAIARAVAEKLRYRYYDWEVISQAATEAGVSPEVVAVASAERPPNLFERVIGRLVAGAPDNEDTPPVPAGPRPSMLSSEDYRQFIEHVVRELARRGDAVIVGHAGQVVLKDVPGVVKVLLTGSLDKRAQRLAQAQGRTVDEARQTIIGADRNRKEFFKRAYHIDWLDSSKYDVALNTDRISVDLARDMIVAVAREVP